VLFQCTEHTRQQFQIFSLCAELIALLFFLKTKTNFVQTDCGKQLVHIWIIWSSLNPFSPVKAPNLAEFCNPVTRQAIELESYTNHPRIQQVM